MSHTFLYWSLIAVKEYFYAAEKYASVLFRQTP